MLGSHNIGSGYYGQGPGTGLIYVFHSVSASVSTVASIVSTVLTSIVLSASVTAVASIGRLFGRVLSASVTALASISTATVFGLNIRRASTKLLNLFRTTKIITTTED
jgi:hypothetical protein